MNALSLPSIIQGGMGAGVSGWALARAVSKAGQLGVVAGTALDLILARRLQVGDPGGHMRRALEHFPIPGVSDRVIERFFVPGGKAAGARFKALPPLDQVLPQEREELIVAANFAEVSLAREGHDGPVGINYLEKIQVPTLPSLFGAMLAGVDFVLMGAGIPRSIPKLLDDLAVGKAVKLPLEVRGAESVGSHQLQFDPSSFCHGTPPALDRPKFLAIVSSVTVATVMVRKAEGRVDGLVIEGPTAGGHNAPPRGRAQLSAEGETVFGARDVPDLAAIERLGLPFWLAGSCASPDRLHEALQQGATGIQVGTAFAFCEESGVRPDLKRRAIEMIQAGSAKVRTDPLASPTGFPFKVFELAETLSDPDLFESRKRVCDLGFLRHAYQRPDGRLGWRCPGEPAEIFVRKGGREEETCGRKCVCNGLMANIGLGQIQADGQPEAPILTSGADVSVVAELLQWKGGNYRARDVLEYLLGRSTARV